MVTAAVHDSTCKNSAAMPDREIAETSSTPELIPRTVRRQHGWRRETEDDLSLFLQATYSTEQPLSKRHPP